MISAKRLIRCLLLSLLFVFSISSLPYAQENEKIFDLDLDQLMKIKVTTAGRKEQNVSDVPAAIYVISQEDIKESGATSLPEVLRMVPGLQVARISSSVWAISARGMNGIFSNKLLVQVDGRTIYVPSFAGVYWDTQNLLLEDVDRIEVIRGPGATLWGANAMNGIINIITKDASKTVGGFVSAGGGNLDEELLALRYGAALSKNIYGRFYLKRHSQDSFHYLNSANGTDSGDDWDATAFGFRLDGDAGINDSWTLQADAYRNHVDHQVDTFWQPTGLTVAQDSLSPRGVNLLGRWTHEISTDNSWQLQAYYDEFTRDDIYLQQEFRIIDVDFQQNLKLGERHDLVWGAGYRTTRSDFVNSYAISIFPSEQTNELLSCFAQDEITLAQDRLWLTIGSKLEKNDYTDYEIQPSARILWKPKAEHRVWAAVSRAVRTPSQIEDNGSIVVAMIPVINPLPPPATFLLPYQIDGSKSLEAEELIAYEIGYRFLLTDKVNFDVTAFYNDYSDLVNGQTNGTNLQFANGIEGESYGIEAVVMWQPLDWFKGELNYTYLKLEFDSPLSNDIYERVYEESSPRQQASLKTTFNLSPDISINLWGQYAGKVKKSSQQADALNLVVDDYFRLDCSLFWQAGKHLELVLAAQNLLDDKHLEFVSESFIAPIEVERSFYAKMNWTF